MAVPLRYLAAITDSAERKAVAALADQLSSPTPSIAMHDRRLMMHKNPNPLEEQS